MRKQLVAWVLTAAALLAPSAVRAQYQEVTPAVFTGPLSHPRYELGGFFVAMEGKFWRSNRNISSQDIAFRGFLDLDGSIAGQGPSKFVGSNDVALSTQELRGPGNYNPGYQTTIGYRFEDGLAVSVNWWHQNAIRYRASASLLPPNVNIGLGGADTFLTSPVSNFPIAFSGNPQNVVNGNPGATFGIWNAASYMEIEYLQKFDMFDIMARVPIWQTDSMRSYGKIGPRTYQFFDRFKWTTIDTDPLGNFTADTTASYTNFVRNNLWGVNFGCGVEKYLGENPLGAFSASVELNGGVYANFVGAEASYDLGDGTVSRIRDRQMLLISPAADVDFRLWWYPWEGIQVSVGYQFLTVFNTVASRRPVDFNYGSLDPGYSAWQTRWMHGMNFGVAFVF